MRIAVLLAVVALTACPGPAPVPEAGPEPAADTGQSNDAAAATDTGQQPQDAGRVDASSAEAGPDAGRPEAGVPDAGPPETCAAGLEGQAALCLEISSVQATPLPEHFSGMLVQDYRSGWQPWDARYIDAAKRFLPGFLGVGAVYSWDWHSGSIPMSNVDVHQLKANKYNQTLDFHKVIRGKGFIKVDDYARTAAAIGAKLVLEANVRTSARYAAEQVESIRAYAEHVARRGYPVLYWKLSSEPIYWADSSWCDQGERPCTPFHQGGDGYATDMKPFFDAIDAGYAAAGQSVPPRVVHHTEGGHTARQRRFDGVELDPETGELQPWSGEGGIAYYGSIADRVAHPQRRKYWDDWGHNWFVGYNAYTPEGGSAITCTSDPAAHWSHFQKHLSDTLAHEAVQVVDDYHLPVNGAEGFDTAPPPGLRGNIGSFSARATTPYTTTMFAAIYAAESMLRWTTHPRLRSAAYFALTSNCMGMSALGRSEARSAGNIPPNAVVTDSVANSEDITYGLFDHLPCLALSLSNRAINLGVARLQTNQHGGLSSAVHSVEEATAPARWVPGPEEQAPATYSAAFLGADGITRVVITNRSDQPHSVELINEGRHVEAGNLLTARSISAPESDFRNYGTTGESARNCVPARQQGHQDLQLHDLALNNGLSVPAWSVTLLSFRAAAHGAPTAPARPQVVNAVGRVELNWPALAGATGYRVLWGTQTGLYTDHADVVTNQFELPYMDGIPIYFALRAQTAGVYGPLSSEVQAQALPVLLASDTFDGQGLGQAWTSGCGDASPWQVAQGRLAGGGQARRCTLHANSSATDQSLRTELLHGGWSDPPSEARLGLVGRYQDHETYVFGGIRTTQENGNWRQRAVIEVHHPSLPGGFLEVGMSARLSTLQAETWFPESLLTGGGTATHLELELSGRTLRLFINQGADRRMIAAGIDSFKVPQGGGALVQEPLELDLERSAAGRGGVLTENITATFDEFSAR